MAKIKNKLKSMDAPAYGYWDALYRSFYSRLLYRDVGKRWRGIGLLYLLFAIAIFSIPLSIKLNFDLNRSFNEQIINPLLALPNIYVQNGFVLFDKPMPYYIKNNNNQVVSIIDTTGAVQGFSARYPEMSILINKNKISIRPTMPRLFGMDFSNSNTAVPFSQTFNKHSNFAFNGKKIVQDNHIVTWKYFTLALVYPVVVSLLFSLFMVFFLVLAFLGQVFSRVFFSFYMPFNQTCRIFMVATTPMLLLFSIMIAANTIFLGSGFLLLFIITVYFSFAIWSLRSDSKRMVRT